MSLAELISKRTTTPESTETLARRRLEALAQEFNHPVADLLDWYKSDLQDLGEFPMERARWIVKEYIANLESYRPNKH